MLWLSCPWLNCWSFGLTIGIRTCKIRSWVRSDRCTLIRDDQSLQFGYVSYKWTSNYPINQGYNPKVNNERGYDPFFTHLIINFRCINWNKEFSYWKEQKRFMWLFSHKNILYHVTEVQTLAQSNVLEGLPSPVHQKLINHKYTETKKIFLLFYTLIMETKFVINHYHQAFIESLV